MTTILNRSAQVLGTIVICCLTAFPSMAQNGGTSMNSRGRTSAEILHEYGIQLTKPALLSALSNPNPKLRMHAAMQLAANHDSDAIPSIERAFSDEKDSMARVGIAGALASLHDPSGAEHLQAICADSASPVLDVIAAVWTLQALSISHGGCAGNLLVLLGKEPDYRDAIISLLPIIYHEASSEKSEQILRTIEVMLVDAKAQPSVRISAGNALAQIGAASSAEVIRSALSREDDPVIRSSLESDLSLLEKKEGTGSRTSPN